MRTITGDAPNSIENQSVIDVMYRAWFFILSIGILLPMRWLPQLLPKPSKITFPVVATAALITCGELMLANPTLTPAGPYCPGAMIQISFTGTNLPEGDNIEVFIDDISTYNPFLGGGTSIGTIPIDYTCTTCPSIMAVMLNPATCSGSYPNDEQNEFMVLGSGCGFNVSNFQLNPSVGGTGINDSIGGSQSCQWSLANATTAANFLIANGTGCSGNIFPAGPTTQIPGGAIVIAFSDAFGPNVPFNFQSLCATGMPIYILSSSCDRLTNFGAYSNSLASSPGYTLTTCSPPTTQFSYNAPPTPAMSGVNNIVALGGASFVSTTSCTDPGLSSLNFPDIPVATATLNYTIPAGICGSGTGLMNFYLSGIIDANAPCADIIYTPPSALSLAVSCPVDIVAAGPFCSNGASVQLTVTGSSGPGTWSGGPYISSTGIFNPALAVIGNNTVIYTEAPCGSVSEVIVVNSPPNIVEVETTFPFDTLFIPSATTCANDPSGQIVNSSYVTGGTAPFTYDWDYADVPGNEVYPDDGNTFFPHGLNGVVSGNYTFIVTDALGCSDVATVFVPEGDPVTATFQIDPILCFGGMTGGIQITSSTGPPVPPIYNWDNIGTPGDDNYGGAPAIDDDAQNISGLGAGSYAITITYEDPGFFTCTFEDTIVLTQPTQLTLVSPDIALPCRGNTGNLIATPSGGTPGYIYNWSHISGPNNPPAWAPVIAGNYIITVTDANGCSIVDVVAVTQPAAALTATATGEVLPCNNGTGDINLTVTSGSGTPPYSFIWSNGPTTEDQSGLNAGTYTVTVTDFNGCTTTAQAVISVMDVTPPGITCPANLPLACNAAVPAPTPGSVTATDACGAPVVSNGGDVTSTVGCVETTTRTYIATDVNGNTASCTQTITRTVDLTPPTITCPAPIAVPGCNGTVPAPNPGTVIASDGCGGITVTFVSDVPSTVGCVETTTRTYMATDACGNTNTCTQLITRTVDITAPVLSGLPGPTTIQCSATPMWITPTVTDGCGVPVLSSMDVTTSGSCPDAFTITRTWTATDPCGNTATASQVINVTDTTPPVISPLPAPSTIECTAVPSWTIPTATDNCSSPMLSFNSVTTSGACPDSYSITRTWTATDECGNTTTAIQVINVVDSTPPVISPLPGPTTIECSATPSWTTPTVTDNCGMPILTFANVTTSGSCPNEYSITRTWTATDECGNTSTATQTINVDDIMPPVISPLPGPTTIECSVTPTWTTPTATDNCSTPTLTFVNVTVNGSCPNEFSITRTWTANDGCGNTATASQTINVDDTTPPVISGLPAPTTIECSATPSWTTPTATDNCGMPTLTFVNVTINGSCPNEFSITRTWTATDLCGNTAVASQTINVDDTTPPVISGLPGPTTIECSATPSFATPTATDNCGMPTLTFANVTINGSCPNEYSITRTWTATDLCGNTAVATQTINVDDTIPPVISALPGATTIECSGTPTFTTPTATDNCGMPTLTFMDVTTNGTCPNEFSITRTWTATDLCGNTTVATQTINVDDTVPPVISALPGTTTIECSGVPSFATPTTTDNCGMPSLTFMDVTTNGTCPNEFSITRTWTATDLCGNTAVATQTINVDDTVPPVISGLPGPTTIECSATPSWATPTATDNCAVPTLTFADVTTNGPCPGTYSITRTWTANDGCGNTATASQTINVDDTMPPVISGLPGPTTIECSVAPAWTTPTVTDNCGTPTLTFADVTTNGSCPNEFSITRTWTANDGCGNTATASQTISVDDTTPPVISGLPAPTTIECSGSPSWTTPTATDNCGTPTLTFANVTINGSCPNEFSITRTWTATDLCGNTAVATQTINVDDTTPPVISGLPGPTTIECSATPSFATPTATDNCGMPSLTFADVTTNGSCPNEFSITRTWTATDLCGNTAVATQTINVDDTVPPVISGLPGPSTIECSGTPTWTTPTATDNCGVPVLTFADVTTNGTCPSEYSITRTWTATDACGNTAIATQTINVDDTMPPVISGLPGPSSLECSGTPSWTTPTATDNCGTPTLTFADVTTNGSCPNEYTITRTWTANDGCGNTATASQVINVDDTTPPVISGLPGPSSMECSGAPSWTTPTVTDNCGTPTLTFADVTTNGTCPNEYSITRTWTANDGCGNTATATQTINVDDTTPPVISGLPGPTTIECSGAPSWTTPTVTDNCGTPTLSFADVTTNGSCPNEYSITRTWTANDGCGNTATASQTINVDDTMPPVISGLPGPTTIECSGVPTWTTPNATDNCDVPVLTFADVTMTLSCAGSYTITRTWTATDDCGNAATATQTINVDDTMPPVISGLPGVTTIECSGTPSWTTPTATDNCGVPVLTFADVTTNGTCPNEYSITRTWTATDPCGNTATATQTINVDDTVPPVISGLPGPSSIECSGTPAWATPTATDNCAVPTLTFADVTTNGPCPNEYTITRTWTANDGCGNTATASQVINVEDTTPPIISGLPGPSAIECSGTPSWTTPTVTDNCGVPTFSFADVTINGSCPSAYTVTRTWTADDGCGNTATASQVFNVDDTTPPVISGLPGPTTIECSATPSWTTPTVTDNCGVPTLTFADVTINGSCPSEFSITRTWTATDLCGNTAVATQTINVDDTTPPVISGLPGPTTIECSATPSFATPTATDNCGMPSLAFSDVTTNGSCPNEFSITRTWTATDLCGNTAVATQTINVDDTVPPVISGLPGPSTIECSGTPSWATPTATDNCGTPVLSFADITTNGTCPSEYSITRTWTANDGCGNTATATQTINIDDTVPPVISGLPGVTTIECGGTPSFDVPTATDNCGVPTLTFADVTTNGACPGDFSVTRTWTANDGCGNTATASQTINVEDTTPPVISGLPAPSNIECSGTPSWTTPTATDNCGVPTLTFADVTTNGSCPNEYSITRTWTADDGCGNTATASQTINVDDTTPPVISGLPGPSTIECSGTPTWTTPTATDNCGTPTLSFVDVTVNGTCPNEYSITRTWTANDGCGNTAAASQTINVDDTTPPVISGLPGPSTIECSGTPSWATPTATDNCGTPTLTFADVTTNGSCPNEYSITRTWTANDGCGNTATASQTINVDDTVPPVISGLPGPSTIECSGTPSWTTPTATDNCGTPTLTFADVTTNGSCPNEYSITRTWTANDGCGNTATASQTINVDDTTPPVISGLPGVTTIECGGTPSFDVPTATDNCGVPTLTFADVTTNGSCPNEYSITRTWTANDGCGNTATASQTINVEDTTPPVISGLPGPSTIECSGIPSWTTPTATDNCAVPTLTFADVTTNGSCPNEYNITRTWTANDGCGNTATASQTINVDDTTPPVISGLPGPSTIECSGTPTWTTPTATDNCATPTLSFVDVTVNGSCPNEYSITRTWTANDGCGNTAAASQTINVDDTTPPVISGLPAPTTIECSGTPSWATPTATDNCGTPTLTFADVTTNGSCPNEYSITRTWTANDGCGNTATASQTINVDDTVPPVISGLPGPSTIECSGTPSWTTPTATDNCGTPTLTFADVTTNGSCPNEYSITRTWTANDGCGNTATASQTINVDDTTPPVISGLPGVTTIECSGTPSFDVPTATDNCAVPTLSFADVTTNGSCPNEYSITRTWTANDGCGNTSTASQTINVEDTTPPVISGLPGPSTIECSGIPSWTTPTATDNCAVPTLTFADVTTNGSCPNEYSITRTWTANDGCGNTATASQTINVDDTTPPVISGLPGPSTIECSGTPSWINPAATDNCAVPTLTFADVTTNGSCPNEYSITRTWTANDGCGNTASASQTISVDDTTPPVISGLPAPTTIECSGTPSWTTPTATDNCGTPTLSFADVTTNGSCPNEYSITRTWTADDGCGNTATASQTINVDDTVPPVISGLPGPSTIECSGTPSWTTPTATDNCGTPTLTFADVTTNGSCPNEYSITRTWTANDGCGNTATASQTINVDDTTPPVISGLPGVTTIECSGTPSFDVPTATDNCGVPTLTFADVTTNGSCPNEYSITRTWTANDGCGNTSTASQTINVEDTTPPVISGLPGPSTIECSGTPSWTTPTATDNCAVPTLTFADVTTNGSCPNVYSITRTWTANDGCGNTSTASQTINVDDTVPPVISGLPGPSTIECSGTPSWTTPTATDNCAVPTLTFADVTTNGTCPNEYSITRTWTANDGCGNTATASQTINVDDTVTPVISGLPGPSTIECSGTPSWTTPTATDNCATPTLTFADVTTNGSCPNEYSITRTWTADDGCGNTATASQTINVDDTLPPVISGLPAPSTIECSGTPSWTTPTATDNCGTPTLTFADVTTNGSCPNEYSITRTWTANDGCGNTATASQTINVDDTTPPVISGLPGVTTIECGGTPSFDVPTATDNCAVPTLTFADVTTNGSCPNEFSITRTWTANDGCGNTSTASQTINVEDTTPPVISGLPAPSTIECSGVPSWTTPTATDNCAVPTLSFVDVTVNGSCPNEFSITRTWTANDGCGNTSTASQTINVEDNTPPVISGLPAPTTIECSGTPSWTTPTATDNCSVPTLTFVDVTTNGSCPNEYSITRTWTATDACGNVSTATQVINVDDTTPPTASNPAPVNVECIDDVPVVDVNVVIGETDNCPGAVTVAFVSETTTGGPCPEVITRTYSVTDACGNQILVTHTITINDITPPTASSPSPVTVDCIADVPAPDINIIDDEADNCPAAIVVAFVSDVSDGGTCPETITRTYSVTDACGNITLVTQSIIVDDDVLPTASNLPPLTAVCIGEVPAPDINLVTDEADNCPGAITVAFAGDVSDGGSCPETITRTYSVTDACGNQILVTQTITVDDNILPTASNPGPLTADCSGSIPLPDVNVVTDEADNCPAPITVAFVSDVSDGGTCPETVTRTYSVTDACGNQVLVTQTITVGDVTNPTASNPAPVNVECVGDVPAPDVNVVTDEADNCAGLLTVAFVNDVSSGGPCPEVITRTYSITDACGNQILVTQTITINDVTPPTASNPAPVMVECIGDVPAADISVVTDETDNCIAPVVVAFVSDVPDGASCPLTITRTYSIIDACGNQNLVTQNITVNDIIPPTATNPSPIIVSGCNTAVPAPDISYVTDAADYCSLPVVAFVSDVADLVGCTETTTRTFSITDACNNSITVEQLITRTVDNSPPVFTNPPADISVNCIAQVPAMAPLDYTDNCSMGGTIVGVETGPSGDPLTITREWTVTDDCGNVATETQTITITQMNGSGTETYTGCEDDGYSVVVNGTTYDETMPTGTETFPGPGGCDSTVIINLIFNPLGFGSELYNGCEGDGYSVVVNGTTYNETNPDGIEILQTMAGCDSTVTIDLNFLPTSNRDETYTGCEDDGYSVVVNGTIYNETNPSGTEIMTGINGCDSTVNILLTFAPAGNGTETYNGCEDDGYSVVVNGTTYDEGTPIGTEVFPGGGGCDSTVDINLVFNPITFGNETHNGCEGDGYFVVVNGTTYDENMPTGQETLTGPNGCDSIVDINLMFSPVLEGEELYSGCEGDGYSVVVNGTIYNESNPDGIEVIMGAGCDSVVTIDLDFAPFMPAVITPAGPVCTEAGIQTLTASPSGGTWSGSVSSDQFNPALLGPGIHEVIYTTPAGPCQSADTIDIVVYELVISCLTIQDETAPMANDGQGQVTVSGGVPNYTVSWTGPVTGSVVLMADGDFIISSLPPGTYTVEVTDATGCTTTCQFTIENAIPCDLSIDDIIIQDATCSGVDNGAATIILSGSMIPFLYSMDGGVPVNNNVFTNLAAGPHTIVVTDAAGCTDVQNFLVGAGPGPSLAEGVTVDASCGDCNGSIDVVVSGGAPPYNYSIDGIMYGLSSLFPGLCAGTYDIYLIDDGGCTDTITLTVVETDAPIITSIDIGGSSCGQSDGSITINATGGLAPLMYSIDGGANFQLSNFFDGHPAGVYPIVVRDAAGCTTTGTATIADIGAPIIDAVITTPTSCGTFDGTITINASGGTGTLMYSIDGGATFQTSNFFEFLAADNYDIVVEDGNGCQAFDMVTLNTTNGPVITGVLVSHTNCGDEDGVIEILATGGTGDLLYSIDGGITFQSSNIFDMLEEGDYDIVVVDESNCPVTDQATINGSEAPRLDVYYTLAHCGKADGQLEVEGDLGVPPYMYSINGGSFSTNNVFVNLISDFYTLAVKDANDCIVEIDVLLEDDDLPEITDVITVDPLCGMTNGSIEIVATGDGLQYSIQTPAVYQASPIFDPVTPGNYTINVRDQYGCFAVASVGVINPMPNPAFTTVVVDSECGMNSGSIDVNATSGTMPYLYSIGGPFVATDIFTGLAAGTYTVTVRDNNNCEASQDVVIISVGTQTGVLDTSICDGEEIIIDGNIFNTAGTYIIPISGGASNGCDSTLTLTLGIDPLLEKEFQDSICVGEVYTYNGVDYTLPGLYVVDTLTAISGCDTILTLDLLVNPLDTTYIDTFICTGGVYTINGMDYTMTGEYLIDTIPGGIGCDSVRILRLVVNDFNELTVSEEICEGETFTINGMDFTMTGLYIIDTLAGPGGCDTVLFLDLVVNPLPTASAGADLTLDCDVLTVTLNGSATGGSPLWTGPDIDAGNETQLTPEVSVPGTYILTVTSAEGCIAIDSVVVNLDPQSVIANAGIDDSLSCDVLQITLQGSPLGPDYTYLWTGPGIDATNENLPNPTITEGGTYTLVVTNTVTQCVSAPDQVIISDISAILIAIIQDPVSFNCFIDSIDLATVGSSTGPNIVYAWFDATGNLIANTPGLEITSGGMFTLIVEDTVSGCFDGDTVMVKDLTQYPQVDAGLPQSIDCDTPTALLNEGATNNNNNIVFQWTSTEGGIIGPDTLITAVVNIPGQYYYLMATDTTNGCQNQDSVFVTDMTELPLADINIAEIITCIDESALLDIGNSTSGAGIMYVWSGPDINNIVSETLETSVPGQYYLDVINETTGCTSRDTALLVAPMEPQDLMATIELPFCEGDPSGTITIDSVTGGTPDYMYSINGGAPQTSPTFEDLYAGVYSIAVVDANGCVYAESYTVADGIQLTIDIGPDIDLVLGDSVILWADVSLPWSQIDSIVWTPIDILSCTYCINPVLYGLQSDVVTATVYSGGCIDQDMLNVRVDVDANIYIPNVFSPNDDGINDYVTIYTDHRVRRIVYFEIFDRWGNNVFIGKDFLPNDPLKGWDGSFKGKVMNPAVFAYIARVELINGDQVDRKGDITIVR